MDLIQWFSSCREALLLLVGYIAMVKMVAVELILVAIVWQYCNHVCICCIWL
jgi:hypothetical protein